MIIEYIPKTNSAQSAFLDWYYYSKPLQNDAVDMAEVLSTGNQSSTNTIISATQAPVLESCLLVLVHVEGTGGKGREGAMKVLPLGES